MNRMERDDLSSKLIHFTKGNCDEAWKSFNSILNQRKLLGGDGYIRGSFKCVCFTESPIGKFSYLFTNPNSFGSSYAPFGIMIDKKWLWGKGGRPVIYQSEEEYELLNEKQRWRHKTYEPLKNIDFTWEREWRVHIGELVLDPLKTTLIVPNRFYVEKFKKAHTYRIQSVIMSLGDETAAGYVKPFEWHFIALEDLGVNIQWRQNKWDL